MRVFWEVDRENQRLYTKYKGRVTFTEIAELLGHSARDGTLHYQLLADAKEAAFDIFPADARRFVELLAQIAKETPLGQTAVITSGETTTGIIHMLAQLATGICKIAPFTRHEDAERWLGWRSP